MEVMYVLIITWLFDQVFDVLWALSCPLGPPT